LFRVTSFGRPLPSPSWRRAWPSRIGRPRFEAFPARVAAVTVLAALVVANVLIVYLLMIPNADPSSGGLRQSRDENVRGSLSDIGDALQDIRASIEARIEKLEPIRIERSARQERPRDRADQIARGSSESSASSGTAPSGSASSGSSSTSSGSSSASSGSSSDSTAGSTSSGWTSGGTGSGDSGGGSPDETTGGTTGSGGAGGGGGSGGGATVGGGSGGGAGGGGGG
jgi:hypothetical protein